MKGYHNLIIHHSFFAGRLIILLVYILYLQRVEIFCLSRLKSVRIFIDSEPLISLSADEWEYYGVIEGSHKITFFDEEGGHDAGGFLETFTKVVTDKEQPFILVCAHVRRAKAVGRLLALQLKYTNVYELDGGINWGWLDKGFKTIR